MGTLPGSHTCMVYVSDGSCMYLIPQVWHKRLCILLYMCLSEGWIIAESWHGWKKLGQASADPDRKLPAAVASEDMRVLRSACKNNLHFACTVMADMDNKMLRRGLSCMTGPVRQAHGKFLKVCTSCCQTCCWYVKHVVHALHPRGAFSA